MMRMLEVTKLLKKSILPGATKARLIMYALALCLFKGALFGQDLPPAPLNNWTIPAGSFVIAMDNTNQALTAPFNTKAYGLADKLLQNGIPLMWSIKSGKAKDAIDFTANASRVYPTSAAAASYNFAGGPLIIHRDFVARLGTLVSGFGNNVAVYRLNADATVDVRYVLSFKPKLAVGASKASVHTNLYDFALIPEYTVVTETTINNTSCYTLMSQPHTNSTAAVAGIKGFVQSGGNFTAQCLAIPTYENDPGGRFMTSGGIVISNVDTPFSYPNPDMAFSQFIGVLDPNPGGSEMDWELATGSNFANGGYVVAQNSGTDTDKFAAMVSKLMPSGSGGVTSYLGGHDYGSGGTDITLINGQRMILNSVFVPPSRPGCGFNFPGAVGYKSVKVTDDATHDGVPSSGDTLTWTIDYVNIGSEPVTGFQVADTLPGGIILQSLNVIPTGTGTIATANPGYTGATGSNSLLSAGAVLGVDGRITIEIETKVSSAFVGTLANQGTATGSGLPPAGIASDNVDNAVTGLLGGTTVPSGSHGQTKNDATLDPTTIQIVAPTAVKLESFEVFFDGTKTTVKWSSGAEVDNLGFNVYRDVAGKRELINPAPIAGSSLRSSVNLVANGENYQWVDDKPLEAGTSYYLEDIDMNGYATLHGPVSPVLRFSSPGFWQDQVLLTDLSKAAAPSPEREFVGRATMRNTRAARFSASNEALQWQIASSGGVRISVNHDGWYRVGSEQLRLSGFKTSGESANWQLFADGEEVPMKVLDDGSIEFFGRGLDLLTADTRVYYLVNGESSGQRLKTVEGGSAKGSTLSQSFTATTERKDRVAYISSLRNGELDNWFGPFVNRNSPTVQDLTANDPEREAPASLRVKLQGLTAGSHLIGVRFNDADLGSVQMTDQENRAFVFDLPASAVLAGQNHVTLQSFGTGNDVSLVDTVSLTYQRRFVAVGGRLRFAVRAGEGVRAGGFDEGEIDIFEVRNGRAERQIVGNIEKSDGTHGFSLGPAAYDREMIAVQRNSQEQAATVTRDNPSGWNSTANKADLVIITPESLYPEAEQLAKMRNGQGFTTEVAAAEDLYDEFSFGVHTPDAVKRFLQIASASWKLKPRYVILFGDSSFDPRNYLRQANRDLVPTKLIDTAFMETASDAWLADFDDDGIEDLSIGRLPVASPAEAGTVVGKIRRYESQPERLRESITLIADRGFENYNVGHQPEISGLVDTTRIERSSMADGKMREAILNGLNDGPMVVTYSGHGSSGLWANYNIFNINDLNSLNNSRMSLYLMMTCLNGFTHNPYGESLAEGLLKKDVGGAVLVWASSGETYPDGQYAIAQSARGLIFNAKGASYRIGDIVRAAKRATADPDVRRTWQLTGDPTLFVK